MTGEKDEGADPDQGSADGVYLEARASGHARVYQAARDMHIRYESEGLIAHRVEGADVVEECPYPGLAAFGPEEARWFFGRDALLAELTGMLSEHLPGRADCRGWLRRRQHPPVEHPALLATGYGDGFQDGLTFSADGRLLASSNITSGALNLWEITGRSPPLKAGSPIVCATGSVTGTEVVAFAPRKPVLAAGCDSGVIRLWNMTDPFHVTPMSPWMVAGPKNDSVNSVAFDASGKTMAASDYGGLVTLWDVSDPAHPVEMSHLTTGYKGWQVTSISPDGHTLAVGYGTTVQLWSIADLAHPHLIPALLTGPTQWVTCIAFDHGGGILAAGNADDNIYLWNTRGPHPGAHLRTLTGHTDIVNSVAFSPDDRTLASSSDDDTVRLWDTATATPIGNPLTGHTDYALAVAFSPARGTLASIGLDEAVYLWNLNVSDAISRICATTAGVLTPSLWHKDLPGVPYFPPCKTQ